MGIVHSSFCRGAVRLTGAQRGRDDLNRLVEVLNKVPLDAEGEGADAVGGRVTDLKNLMIEVGQQNVIESVQQLEAGTRPSDQ